MQRIPKKQLESFNVYLLPDARSIAFWVMEYLSDGKSDRLRAGAIASYIVDELGISISRQAVYKALTKATKARLCHYRKNKGFKLMKKGQDELLKQMRMRGVTLLRPERPFSAIMELGDIFSQMKGVIRINDPYIDERTLDVVYRYFSDSKATVRILTSQIRNVERFRRELNKLQKQGIPVEVRKIDKGILHDRYFIDDKHFWLSGNSLNNLGKKESFIVMLSGDIRQVMLRTFNSRWNSAIVI